MSLGATGVGLCATGVCFRATGVGLSATGVGLNAMHQSACIPPEWVLNQCHWSGLSVPSEWACVSPERARVPPEWA